MKIKVSIPEEMHLHNETFMLARVIEVEIDDEQMKVLAQEVAAQLRLHLTGGILPASEPLSAPTTGTGIEYLRHQPTSK